MNSDEKLTPEEAAKRAAAQAKRDETRARNKLAKLEREKQSVCWMDEDLHPVAMKLDPLERYKLADQLEQRAEQLRGFAQKPIPFEKAATVRLRPNVKQAVIAFADRFGAHYKTEDEKLDCGIRWFLEGALPRFEDIVSATSRYAKYREDEGFECSVLSEKLIGDALEKWKAKQSTDEDDED